MKLHIGLDSQSGLAHRAVVTPANVHEKHPLPDLLHGNEQRAYGDSAYASQKKLIQGKAPRAKDFTNQRTRRAGGSVNEVQRGKNRNKSKIRAQVEHIFGLVTRVRHQNADFAFLAKPPLYKSTTYAHFLGSCVVATVLLFCSGSIWVLRYTRRLFIKLTRSKSRTYAQLVQSFRDAQGQPRQRTVLTLGRVDESGGTLDAVLSTLLRAKGRSGVDITTPQVRFESALALGDV